MSTQTPQRGSTAIDSSGPLGLLAISLLLHRRSSCTCSCPCSSFTSFERGYLPALTCKTRASFDIFSSAFFFFCSLALLSFFFSHATRRVAWHRVLTPRQPISCPNLLVILFCSSCCCVALHGYRFAVLAVCFLNPFIKGATAFFAVAVNMIFRLRFSLFQIPCSAGVERAYRR